MQAQSRLKDDSRNEHDIPLPTRKPVLLDLLKIYDFLLQLVLPRRDLLSGRHAPPVLADSGKVWGGEEVLEEVAARLACCANNEGALGCFMWVSDGWSTL